MVLRTGIDGAGGNAAACRGAAGAAAACHGARRLRGRSAAPAAHHALLGLHRRFPLRVRSESSSFAHNSRGLVPAFLQRSGACWNTQHAKGLYQETCMTADDTACRGFQVLGRHRCIRHNEFIHQCCRHVNNHGTQEDEGKGIRGRGLRGHAGRYH